jgi:hypothetical protein
MAAPDALKVMCEKLFNAGKIRHHARSFRNQLRIVVSGMAGKHFV